MATTKTPPEQVGTVPWVEIADVLNDVGESLPLHHPMTRPTKAGCRQRLLNALADLEECRPYFRPLRERNMVSSLVFEAAMELVALSIEIRRLP